MKEEASTKKNFVLPAIVDIAYQPQEFVEPENDESLMELDKKVFNYDEQRITL